MRSLKKKASEKEAKEKHKAASETTKKRQVAYDAIEASRVAATTGGGTSKVSATYGQHSTPQPLSPEATEKLAAAVKDIVKATTGELSFWIELCTTMLGHESVRNIKPEPGSALSVCIDLMATSGNPDKRELFLDKFLGFEHEAPSTSERLQTFQTLLVGMKFKDRNGKDIKVDGAWGQQISGVTKIFLTTCSDKLGKHAKTAATLDNIENLIKAARLAKTKGCKGK